MYGCVCVWYSQINKLHILAMKICFIFYKCHPPDRIQNEYNTHHTSGKTFMIHSLHSFQILRYIFIYKIVKITKPTRYMYTYFTEHNIMHVCVTAKYLPTPPTPNGVRCFSFPFPICGHVERHWKLRTRDENMYSYIQCKNPEAFVQSFCIHIQKYKHNYL